MKSKIHELTKINRFNVSKHLKSLLFATALFIGASSFVSAQNKIAHINKEELIKAMPAYATAQAEVEKLAKTYEAEFQDQLKEIDVKVVPDLGIYRTRKVRILNGSHTTLVPVGLLNGTPTVSETLKDDFLKTFLFQTLFNEIIPSIDFDKQQY